MFCGHGHTYERIQVKNGEYLVPTSDRRTFTPVIGGTIHMQLGDMRGTGSNGRWFHCAVNGKEMVVTIRDANNEIKTDESFTLYAAELNDYTVNFNAIGNGTIAASSNNEAVSDGQALKECSDIVFTATPDEGYAIKNWIVNGETVESKETTYTIDGLKENTTVTVEFESLSGVDNVLDATLRTDHHEHHRLNGCNDEYRIRQRTYLARITCPWRLSVQHCQGQRNKDRKGYQEITTKTFPTITSQGCANWHGPELFFTG